VFVSASYRTGGALLNVLPDGKHGVAWTSQEIGTHFNTAIQKDGYLYASMAAMSRTRHSSAWSSKTGKVMWRVNPEWTINRGERQHHDPAAGDFRGTLLAVDGRFLCLGELGHLLWLDLTPQAYKEIARTGCSRHARRGRCRCSATACCTSASIRAG